MLDQKLLQLEHGELQELDREIAEFNKMYDNFYHSFGSPYAQEVINEKLKSLLSRIKELKECRNTAFENFFLGKCGARPGSAKGSRRFPAK